MESIPIHLLSKEQKYAYIKFAEGHNLFVTGPGGSGKTQLIHTLVQYCKNTGKEVAVCALTGCAAVLLQSTSIKAKTIHSWSGIKLAKGSVDKIIQSVLTSSSAMKNWKKVNVLIVDEVSMMSLKILELLEHLARRVRRNSLVFGGIQIVFTGDFYQLPPVGDMNEPTTCHFCFQSKKWREIFPNPFNSILLQTIFRQTDPLYKTILNQIRVGELSDDNAAILNARVGIKYDETEIITRLFPVKSKVETINHYNYEKIKEKNYTQEMIIKTNTKIYLDTGKLITGEILEQCQSMTSDDIEFELKRLLASVPTNETVQMKKGTIVMLTFNLSVDEGLCNGSQGIIIDILENQTIIDDFYGVFAEKINLPLVKFSNGIIIRITPRFWQSDDFPRIIVGQFPLIHAWALTFHKAQGATLERAEVDAGSSVFEYGQSYVGLSRIRSLEGLYLTNFHPKRIKAHPAVKEFYRGILPVGDFTDEIVNDSNLDPIAIAVNDIIDIPMAEAIIVPVNERFKKFDYIVEKLP
jgi:ATP-dependent DNA helicase PIF1